MVIYSARLRGSELINLIIADIDSERMVINLRGAKGIKDRITLLSKNTLISFRDYYKEYKLIIIFLKDKTEKNIQQQLLQTF